MGDPTFLNNQPCMVSATPAADDPFCLVFVVSNDSDKVLKIPKNNLKRGRASTPRAGGRARAGSVASLACSLSGDAPAGDFPGDFPEAPTLKRGHSQPVNFMLRRLLDTPLSRLSDACGSRE